MTSAADADDDVHAQALVLLTQLATHARAAAAAAGQPAPVGASEEDEDAAADAVEHSIADLFSFDRSHPEARPDLAAWPYEGEAGWGWLLRHCLALLPSLPAHALNLARFFTLLRNLCTVPLFQRRLRSDMVRLLTTGSAGLGQCVALVRAMEQAVAHDDPVRMKPLFMVIRGLLQLWANMLTPQNEADEAVPAAEAAGAANEPATGAAWHWVQTALYPSVLDSVLRLHAALSPIAICIVHHALLCQSDSEQSGRSALSLQQDLSPQTRAAVDAFLQAEHEGNRLAVRILHVQMLAVERQLEEEAQEQEGGEASSDPPSVWEWLPQGGEPCWLVHIIGVCMRSSPTFLSRLQPILSAQQWLMLLRLVEVWAEGLAQSDTLDKERTLRAQADAPNAAAATPSSTNGSSQQAALQRTAGAITGNMACLAQWLQSQPHQPLPATASPATAATAAPAATDDASASSSASHAAAASSDPVPAAPSSSLPIDCATLSVLNTLGLVLLVESWEGGDESVLGLVRVALLRIDLSSTLLDLLEAADALDGGTMFSELYSRAKTAQAPAPAPGHTRHTRPSEDPQAYVNQFNASGELKDPAEGGVGAADATPAPAPAASPATADADATSAAPAAPLPPASDSATLASPRRTPYFFKSSLLRLLSSLPNNSRLWQDALGARALYALMNHSVLDDHNPLMREYSVLGLRNLLAGHEDNQRLVAELRASGIANQTQLREAGVEAKLEEETGKVRISTIKPAAAGAGGAAPQEQ